MLVIGREREREAMVARLERHRVVTLVGTAGIGKSHLARTLGWELVDLDGVSTEHELGRRLNAATGRQLVLDQADALEAPAIEALVRTRHEHLLVTRREHLRIEEEAVLPVGPLAVPARSATEVRETAAVRLLCERARTAGADVDVMPDELLAEIARRLDGVPLALTLAGPRLRTLGPEALVERLRVPHRTLTRGPRDAPPQHSSLARAIGLSWDALDEPLRRALARLAIWPGTFDLAQAEEVVDDHDASDLVERLCDKSLVLPMASGYRILVPVRAFVRQEGQAYVPSSLCLRSATLHFERGAFDAALTSLRGEPDASVEAWHWHEIRASVLRRSGRYDDARQACAQALDGATGEARWRVLGAHASIDLEQGYLDSARENFEAIAKKSADPRTRALACGMLGHVAQELGRLDDAATHYEAASAALAPLDPRLAAAYAGYRASVAHERGDDDADERYGAAIEEVAPHAPHFAGLFSAAQGALRADAGDEESARAAFGRAGHELAGCDDAAILRAVAIHGCALSSRAPASGGVTSDDVRFAERLRRRAHDVSALEVGKGWVRLGAERIDLSRRPTLWRILGALIDARRTTEDGTASREALIEAGWRDEKILPKAAAHRLRVAIHTLRRMGLHDIVERRPAGYALTGKLLDR